jgi:D-alanine-D-alanine ligase
VELRLPDRLARVIVAHNPVGPLDDPSTSDVLSQVELVAGTLAGLGVEVVRLPVAGWRIWEDLAAIGVTAAGGAMAEGGAMAAISAISASSELAANAAPAARGLTEALAGEPGTVVFNLVEAPAGLPAVHPATAAALELLDLPFTGSSAACLWLTTDKLATRAVLAAHGLPVAPGGRLDPGSPCDAEVLERVPPPWILKPACEDASLGLDGDAAVCTTREAALARAGELARRFPGQPVLVERYLPGRELNVSLLATPEADRLSGRRRSGLRPAPPCGSRSGRPAGGDGDPGRAGSRRLLRESAAGAGGSTSLGEPVTLPVAEIEFVDFPPDMPRIVGYEAKWQPESFAYVHTVRSFPRDAASAPLLAEARRLALAAWRACGLAGYGRVDLRLDEAGAPHVLEVNANPCLAPDAGFLCAAEQAGLTPAEVIARIVTAAVARHQSLPARPPRPAPLPAPAAAAPAAAAALADRRPRRPAARRLRAAG